MELTLLEEFLLLALDDSKGDFFIDNITLSYGLAGAIMFQLQLNNSIEIKDQIVHVNEHAKEEDSVLNRVLYIIRKSKPKRLDYWINEIAPKTGNFKKHIITELIIKRVLRKVEGKILWIIPGSKYLPSDEVIDVNPKTRLSEIVYLEGSPELKDVMLLNLIQASGMMREIFEERETLKMAKKNFYKVARQSKISKTIMNIIDEVKVAVYISLSEAVPATS